MQVEPVKKRGPVLLDRFQVMHCDNPIPTD
jgi:hypothetical protein